MLLAMFQLCCFLNYRPRSVHLAVTMDLGDSAIVTKNFHDYLLLVQSYVLSPGYPHQSFFTIPTLDAVWEAIANSGPFFVTPGFILWTEFCAASYDFFVQRHKELDVNFMAEKRRSCENFYT